MPSRITILLLAIVANPVQAQATRDEVRAQAREAMKQGDVAGSADSYGPPTTPTARNRTHAAQAGQRREDVKSQARDAVRSGSLADRADSYNPPRPQSTKSREQRKAETRAAIAQGGIPRGAAAEAAPTTGTEDGRIRSDVKDETVRAKKAGQVTFGEAGTSKN